jgi:hypothetical protein
MDQLVHHRDPRPAPALRAARTPRSSPVTAPALRRLIAQASAFLNSGGRDLPDSSEIEEAQTVIDRLLERLAAG